jgi:hypothetical protein
VLVAFWRLTIASAVWNLYVWLSGRRVTAFAECLVGPARRNGRAMEILEELFERLPLVGHKLVIWKLQHDEFAQRALRDPADHLVA